MTLDPMNEAIGCENHPEKNLKKGEKLPSLSGRSCKMQG
jgi:hypothetical protein